MGVPENLKHQKKVAPLCISREGLALKEIIVLEF